MGSWSSTATALVLLVLVIPAGPAPGQIVFSPAEPVVTPIPDAISLGDFDGDTVLDLVTGNHTSSTVGLYLGDGLGGFGSGTFASPFLESLNVAVGNFNGGVNLNVVAAGESQLTVSFGTGTGNFSPVVTTVLGVDGSGSLAVGDFNEDGIPDVAAGHLDENVFEVLLGDGTGNFGISLIYAGGGRGLVCADFNDDGHIDLAGTQVPDPGAGFTVMLGDGNGGFVTSAFPVTFAAFDLAAGDANGDTLTDLVVIRNTIATGCGGTGVLTYLGDGTGSFTSMVGASGFAGCPLAVEVADLDSDTDLDALILTDEGGGTIYTLAGNGDGTFDVENSTLIVPGADSLRIADLDGDDRADFLVAASLANTVTPYLNTTAGDEDLFRRGDVDADGTLSLVDPTALLMFLFVPGSNIPTCQDSADFDDSGVLSLPDGVALLNFLFIPGSPPPATPGPDDCGADLAADSLPPCVYDPALCP